MNANLMNANELGNLLLDVLPPDGSAMGNLSAREALSRVTERPISEDEYEQIKDRGLAIGTIRKGRGRGGAIALADGIEGGSQLRPSPWRHHGTTSCLA